jgi:DNA-damage-inducible protein J
MAESRVSVRIDEKIKKTADKVFQKLGLNMSTGITIYLNRVAQQQGIPFPLVLNKPDSKVRILDDRAKNAVNQAVNKVKAKGLPVALYDSLQKCPYLEYPDGRKEYNLDRQT